MKIIALVTILGLMVLTMLFVGVTQRKRRRENLESQELKVVGKTVVGGTTVSRLAFTHAPGRSTNVLKLNGDSEKVIILVHNTPFNKQVWQPVFMTAQYHKNLGEKIPTMYAYDMLGHATAWVPVDNKYNDANMQNRAWSIDEFIADLYEVYHEYVGDKKVTLVGYGTGASVVQAFSLKHPELVESLYILGMTIGPERTGIPDYTPQLVQWLNQNQTVTYLTLAEPFVDYHLCLWFEIDDKSICPYRTNAADTENTYNTVEYLLGEKMFRIGNAATFLQMDKIVSNTDFRKSWSETRVSFPITVLIADNDNYTNLEILKGEFVDIKKATPNPRMYIIKGKHGFPLTNPEYIYQLILGKDMANDSATKQVLQ